MAEPANHHNDMVVKEVVSFFDTLPCEVLPEIVRYISERPGSDAWFSSFHHVDVFTVLKANKALRNAAHECFTKMRLGISSSILHSAEVVSSRFMRIQAPQLKSLFIDNWGSRSLEYESMRDCINLRKLTLGEDLSLYLNFVKFDAVFSACGKTLLHLCIQVRDKQSMKSLIDYAAKYCTSLHVLDVWHLTKLSTIKSLVNANRKSLTELRTTNRILKWSEENLKIVAESCTALNKLELPPGIAVPLCQLISNRLHVLVVSCPLWNASSLHSLMSKCHNAVIEGNIAFNAEMIKACQGRIRSLILNSNSFSTKDLNQDPGNVREIFSTMFNLEEVTIELESINSKALLQAFFAKQKLELRKLKLVGVKHECVLDIIANSTGAIEEFKCSLHMPLDNKNCASFLAANVNLSLFEIRQEKCEHFSECDIKERISLIVKELQVCRQLRKFTVDECGHPGNLRGRSTVIEDSCVPLRWRGINIEIGGVRYLPVQKWVDRKAQFYI